MLSKVMKLAQKSEDIIRTAVEIAGVLKTPGAVALVPTETVYGLICRAGDPEAVEKICSLKHRAPGKFFGWFIRDWKNADSYGLQMSPDAEKLAEKYFPGAVTLIVSTKSGSTQAIRIPDHPLIKAVLEYFDEPLVQTSANASGLPDALSLQQALEQLNGVPDITFDGGNLHPNASGSTIVDTVSTPMRILRQGAVSVDLPV